MEIGSSLGFLASAPASCIPKTGKFWLCCKIFFLEIKIYMKIAPFIDIFFQNEHILEILEIF